MNTGRLLGFALTISAFGCVSTGKYDAAVADAARAKSALEAQRKETARVTTEKEANALGCQKELDEATAVNQGLHAELVRLGADADQLLAARGALDQARARLEELRKAQAAAEARSALYRDLALKLKRMIDAGDLQISLRSGRMVLVLPNDVLFDSGKASLKPNGRETLQLVATALATIPGRRFQVSGHTDNEPIRFSGFTSNWQLSSERALAVVSLMIQSGMRADTLSAAGYAEFDPLSANDTTEGRARNRRTEIVLQPNIDELVAVPQATK